MALDLTRRKSTSGAHETLSIADKADEVFQCSICSSAELGKFLLVNLLGLEDEQKKSVDLFP